MPIISFHYFVLHLIPDGPESSGFPCFQIESTRNNSNNTIYAKFECLIMELDRKHKHMIQEHTTSFLGKFCWDWE
jgi:hypothetical protein